MLQPLPSNIGVGIVVRRVRAIVPFGSYVRGFEMTQWVDGFVARLEDRGGGGGPGCGVAFEQSNLNVAYRCNYASTSNIRLALSSEPFEVPNIMVTKRRKHAQSCFHTRESS